MSSDNAYLTLGYDLDAWNAYGEKRPVAIDASPNVNSHILLAGMSGSGKSYAEQQLIARLHIVQHGGLTWLADYKGEDALAYLRNAPRYRSYRRTLEALDAVHGCLNARLSGEDESRHPVTLVWDEYMASMLALIAEDKKAAAKAMGKVAEILLMGRSMGVRLVCSLQRPDAIAFPVGSRLNYGVVIVLGAAARSIYEMLMPDFIDEIKGRTFGRGEGVALLQGSELRFIKVPAVECRKMQDLCLEAVS